MPTELNIPAKTEHRCSPCEYHKCIGALCVRQGPGGYREYVCQHPDANDELTPLGRSLFGAGKYIGKTEKQPDWCPLRREPANVELSDCAGEARRA